MDFGKAIHDTRVGTRDPSAGFFHPDLGFFAVTWVSGFFFFLSGKIWVFSLIRLILANNIIEILSMP